MMASSPGPEENVKKEGEDKDSLFSSEESIVFSEEKSEEHVEEEQLPEYTEEELNLMVFKVKDITILYDLKSDDWTPEVEQGIKRWLQQPHYPLLCIFFEGHHLQFSFTAPTVPILDLMYFLREPFHWFDPPKFLEEVIFGNLNKDIANVIFKTIQCVYAPVFFNAKEWPDSVKNDFYNYIHNYSIKLNNMHHKNYGLTLIYIPKVILSEEKLLEDKEVIKRLEGIVVTWTKQIRNGIQAQDQNNPDDLLIPVDEYEFWKYRYDNLLGLKFQTNLKSVETLCDMLKLVQSTYIWQFLALKDELEVNIQEAKSNIEYLNVLIGPCNDLSQIKSPEEIPEALEEILHLIRFIWIESPYYNSVNKITNLFRSVSNQVINQCVDFIDLDLIFVKRHTRKAISVIESCIQCMINYNNIYKLVSESHAEYSGIPWDLDNAPIFNHIDSFVQRCKDLIEICESMIVFGHFDESEQISIPSFPSARSNEFETFSKQIEDMFLTALNQIEKVRHRILDVQISEWYDDILMFRTKLKNVEVLVENLTNAVFNSIANVEEGVESLGSLYNYANRVSLRALFESKTNEVYRLFKNEIQRYKQDMQDEENLHHALLPYYAGRALNVNMKKSRLQKLKSLFDEATWLMPCSIAREVFTQYDKLMKAIDERTLSIYRKFVDTIGDDVPSRLNRPLMNKSLTRPGLLECNIDRSLLTLLKELKYWKVLGYDPPGFVKQVYAKYDNIFFMYDCVLTVVIDYNKIVSSLSDEERLLFKPLVNVVEKKIAPGLKKLTWAAEIGDEYISECCNTTAELQAFLDDYKSCNLRIVGVCEKICDTPFIQLNPNYAFDLNDLVDEIIKYMGSVIDQLLKYYKEIVDYLILVFEGFEPQLFYMANQWIKYIQNFDTLIEEALKICCRNSLQYMYEALHGDGTIGPNPLLKVKADLSENRINFTPSLKDVARIISNMHSSLVEALKALPRLNDKFRVSEMVSKSYSQLIEEDQPCMLLQQKLNTEVMYNVKMVKEYMKIWEPFRDLWEVDKERFIQKYESRNPSPGIFDSNIGRYTEVANNVQIQETVSSVHFLVINCADLKKAIIDHCIGWQEKLCQLLYKLTENRIRQVYSYIEENTELMRQEPQSLEEMAIAIARFSRLSDEVGEIQSWFPIIKDQMVVLDKYKVAVPEEVRSLERNSYASWLVYLENLSEAESMLNYCKEGFKTQLLEEIEVLHLEAKNALEDFTTGGPFTSAFTSEEALAYLNEVKQNLYEMRDREADIIANLNMFGLSLPENSDMLTLSSELDLITMVWELADEWERAWNVYKLKDFITIETEEMDNFVYGISKRLTRLSKELKERNWPIVDDTKREVECLKKTLPLIVDLKNPAMRSRHWDKLRSAIGKEFDETSDSFTLGEMYNMSIYKYADEVAEISNSATMELRIEKAIEGIAEIWATQKLDIICNKDMPTCRIRSIDDCYQLLEDNLAQLYSMKATRYVQPFSKTVDYWESTLSYVMEVLELAMNVQRDWLYLENIFFGEDTRKQLPKETRDYDCITIDWSEITMKLYYGQTALKATHYKPAPFLLNKLAKMKDNLDLVQRSLEIYLETKRRTFPRFYFLSNSDTLEILGNSKKPEVIQPHLKKMFDNLVKLEITKNLGTNKLEALGMYSDDGEFVEFNERVIIDGPVEMYLLSVEQRMKSTLKGEFKSVRGQLKKMLNKRDKWLLTNCGQLCIAASLIQWTTDCTRALVHAKLLESKKPLKRLKKKQNQVLSKLSEMCRKELTKLQRLKTNGLITLEIHSKDVIDKLYKSNCREVSAFEWFSQLRYYWDRDVDDCIIRQTNTSFLYGYEYNGNTLRCVITPLTDRCYMTLTTALHLYRGGGPKGPAGTGKTATVRDLGRAIAIRVLVNNCSEGLDYKSMGKCFSGLAQTGSWGCFDEFNRINIEVLSVVAQQILSILTALSQKKDVLVFEGTEIPLKHSLGVFITMNPGYAGRTELPDNLKAMFRPISMMVPDSNTIAENVLFSDGFQNNKVLAKKVFTLYQLAKQQLSKQNHYDFGLRPMVALLRYAGKKRRVLPHLPEEQIMYLAMRDMNIARLTSDDAPLFQDIMSDIFPGVILPVVDYLDMISAMNEFLEQSNLQSTPITITKVIQLYESKSSRHCIMLLGKAGTGKSVCWATLQGTVTKLAMMKKPGFAAVECYPLNPKVLNLGELYGEFNLSTNEWSDGVISTIMRNICTDPSPEEKWILFDGPVDAVWIEDMNSVMDDNKVLTLINSDRISVPDNVCLLFEVEDLSQASPATISRCAIVFSDYKDLGWWPVVTSWLKTQEHKGKRFQEVMKGFFTLYVDNMLEFKKMNCAEPVPVAEMACVTSLCKLLEVFATKENGLDSNVEQYFEDNARNWFLYCMLWSICGTTNEEGRKKFDAFIREKEGVFPVKSTVYEFCVDLHNRGFTHWEERLPYGWKYDAGTPFYKIRVPTVDTIRYNYLIANLITAEHAVLLVGGTGSGKTSCCVSVIDALDPSTFGSLYMTLASQTTSQILQDSIESKFQKRTKNIFIPVGKQYLLLYLDELNMPAKEVYGAQPPLELLRQWFDYGFWYNRKTRTRKYMQNMLMLASITPPGGGRSTITERLQSKYILIYMTSPDEATLTKIYGSLLSQHLADFDEEIKIVGRVITDTTIDLYKKIVKTMLPTPAKLHYLFNLRDVGKVFQGMLRSHKDYQNTKQNLLRLWVHECFRVFVDRMADENDREWFFEQINDQLGGHFDLTLHSLCPDREIPIFAHFMNPHGVYEDLVDLSALKAHLYELLREYNDSPGSEKMDLVLFREVVEHICRIVRIISQPRGNMMLVGIGGGGRRSMTRVAVFICDMSLFQIGVRKNYKISDFRDDMKQLYYRAGVRNRETVFLFLDTQIVEECFLEIINNILGSAEIPNLYRSDEFDEVAEDLSRDAKRAGIPLSREALYQYLIERVIANLHVVISMNPVSQQFRNRLREYSTLVNNTSIDWYSSWPRSALLEIASKYVADIDFLDSLVQTEIKDTSLQEKMEAGCSEVCATIHDSVSEASREMTERLKRHTYVTGSGFLEFVGSYKSLLSEKRAQVASQGNKLRNGLAKIDDCREKVSVMSVELEEAQVLVAEFQQQCDDDALVIVAQTKEADEQQREVTKTSIKIGEEEIECKKLAEIAQADLDECMPALEEAIKALDSLSKKDISELKSYGKPPQKVELVLEAVMTLKCTDTSWAEAKRQLGDLNFLRDLKEFDKNNISDKTIKKLEKYTHHEDFVPEKIGIVSLAAKSLCLWCLAMEKYAKVYKVVAPKKAKFDSAMESLVEKQTQLAEAQQKLAELNLTLQKLQKEYNEKLAQKEELAKKAEMLKLKLERAATLVENLKGERERWDTTVKKLATVYSSLPGDVLSAVAFVSYMGPFVASFREMLEKTWLTAIINNDIPYSIDYSVQHFLCDPTTIREWNIQGLPADLFSTQNGIIIERGSHWPLIIDPQGQAYKWIQNMEAKNDLKIIDYGAYNYMATVEQAIRTGKPVLLANIGEYIEPLIQPVINKILVVVDKQLMLKSDDNYIPYDMNFKFYITSYLNNPHYSPEIATKTNIVNFALMQLGLEAQLLGIVVRKERPQLEEQKDNLVMTIATGKRTLMDLENELLALLNETRGSLLEDAALFNNLKTSKTTALAVGSSLEISEQTEVQIDKAREGYRSCAKRASILFFVLNDLGKIDPMYQFALDPYIFLFIKSIARSQKATHLPKRIMALNDYHTYAVYKNTCRALFEEHKLLFSFHICIRILEDLDKIVPAEYNFLLKGGVVLDREEQMPNPCKWLSEECWDNITELDKVAGFHGIIDSFEQYGRDWFAWFTDTEPESKPLIAEWEDICNEFQKILIIRSLRQDRVPFCLTSFIVNQIGPQFVDPPVLDIKAAYDESSAETPLLFVLSPGVDPTVALYTVVETCEMRHRFQTLSLGQGQAPVANRMLQNGFREGFWIFLANCHLSLTWMPRLEKVIQTMQQPGKVHPDFRLWLSSSPNPKFPVSILQSSIKMTTEAPKGLKSNLKRLYQLVSEEQFSRCQAKEKYKRLLFAMTFFHAVLLERKKFQHLGWNMKYSFNDSDFEFSEVLLSTYLDEYPQTPWDALKFLIAGINYGGHVTDNWDRRLLMTYINQYFCEDAINITYYRLSSLPTYYIPRDGSIQSYLDYITLLPNIDRPEVFGQHPNADIASLMSDSRNLFSTLLSIQMQESASSLAVREKKVSQMAADVLSKTPHAIDYERAEKLMGPRKEPLDVILLQEIERYNKLLEIMRSGLENLQKGIKGLVVMSSELDNIFVSIYEGSVPTVWLKVYPSLKKLGSWTRELIARVEVFSKWAETLHPPLLYWLTAFTFPTGFLTAVLQCASRVMQVPIDTLSWEFNVLTVDNEMIVAEPDSGVYIRGLLLEGAGWDKKNACLIEPQPMQLVTPVPVIHFKPAEQLKKKTKGLYVCPTYYYPLRAGTENRPSFVVSIDLKTGAESSDFWIKRGTALLLSLAN